MKLGSEAAAIDLWDRFFARLVFLAQNALKTTPRQVSDEEDVVLETFNACVRSMRDGKYSEVRHRGEFWFLLVRIAERKALDQRRRLLAKKRRPDEGVSGDLPFLVDDDLGALDDIEQLADREPTPEFAAIFAEESLRLFELLEPRLREVVRLRCEGYTNAEIAHRISRSIPAVERYVRLVREKWSRELSDDP